MSFWWVKPGDRDAIFVPLSQTLSCIEAISSSLVKCRFLGPQLKEDSDSSGLR